MRIRLTVLMLLTTMPAAHALDQQYKEVIEFNGRLYATLTQTLMRCPGVRKVSKYGVESLRSVYDPGEEIRTFDAAAAGVTAKWAAANMGETKQLCDESLRINGPTGSKWLSR